MCDIACFVCGNVTRLPFTPHKFRLRCHVSSIARMSHCSCFTETWHGADCWQRTIFAECPFQCVWVSLCVCVRACAFPRLMPACRHLLLRHHKLRRDWRIMFDRGRSIRFETFCWWCDGSSSCDFVCFNINYVLVGRVLWFRRLHMPRSMVCERRWWQVFCVGKKSSTFVDISRLKFAKNIMNSFSRWSAKEANLDIGWIDLAHGQGSDFLWSWQQFQDVNMWSHTNRWAAWRKFNFSFTLSANQIIANTRAVTKEVKDIEQTNATNTSIQIERCQPWRSQDPLSWGEQEKIHQIMEPHSLRPRQVQQTLYYQMARRVLPNF